jgi:tol-pal system protein YbgF
LSSRRGDAFDPAVNPNSPGAPRPLGTMTAAAPAGGSPPYDRPPPISDATLGAPGPRQPGAPLDLSTLSAPPGGQPLPPPPPSNPNATGATATLPPINTPKDVYDLAYGYVLHKDYALAADTFRTFLHQYPSDRQAQEAQYWLGESLFQQQQYRDAAESFLAVSTKYETTTRASEALLRLGQSLAALGEKEAACASLGEVLRKYPHAPLNVKQGVEREQKRDHC